jgi:hypothetical protein
MKRARLVVAAAVVGIASVAVADAGPVAADHRNRATAAFLTGAKEVPGPGDPDGFGFAGVVINADRGVICYAIAVRNIAPATLAHIHRGGPDVAGDIVVHLEAPTNGYSADCVSVDKGLAGEIAHNPGGFYVNVHNADFGAGAVRGQLR